MLVLSELNGICQVGSSENILSIGVSSACVAELEMLNRNPGAHIIATTIDNKGVEYCRKLINDNELSQKIEVRLEDVTQPMPYKDGYFDFVYARLVLHYLTNQELSKVMLELKRVLKQGSVFYIVVRSVDCPDVKERFISKEESTGMVTYKSFKKGLTEEARNFHTVESLTSAVESAGFKVKQVKQYDEQLFQDFERTKLSWNTDNLIEVTAIK